MGTINKRNLGTVYADVHAGHAVTHDGQAIDFSSQLSLPDLLDTLQQSIPAISRLFLCGALPENYKGWLADVRMFDEYRMASPGLYLDAHQDENCVARYEHRATHNRVDIRSMYCWYGDVEYTPEQAREGMLLLSQYLKASFFETAIAYATPALTFQQLWATSNRIEKKKFALLPDDIRSLIRQTTGQGRIELTTLPELKKIPALHYYDGIFMYAALTWGMPTEMATHDNVNEYAGKVPARYLIRYTVPTSWQHIGLFATPKEQVTGDKKDSYSWCYPGMEHQGQTFETWVDGSELDVAYTLPQGMPEWDITILERMVFKPEKDSATRKPLDSVTNKLVKMRASIEQDATQDVTRKEIYRLARGAVRNILLHGIGTFHRYSKPTTLIIRDGEPEPDKCLNRRPIEDTNLIEFLLEGKIDTYTQQFEHPEWTGLIWARCRARMIKAALSLPREQLIAIRTDAIAVTTEQPQWEANTKIGQLREKWHIGKSIKAPHSFEELDTTVRKNVKGDN